MDYFCDDTAWLNCHINDLWIFDKLILAKKLGYTCGPAGVDVICPGNYIVRPISNIMGMGIGAEFKQITGNTDDLPAGHFWCEIFEGRHLSVDYVNGNQVLCVEGFKDDPSIVYKWTSWKRTNDVIPLPDIFDTLKCEYKYINCEFIGDKLIEAHLRLNPNFRGGEEEMMVVWEGDDIAPPPGMKFVKDADHNRIGFFVSK
jgi:hypothetical protein